MSQLKAPLFPSPVYKNCGCISSTCICILFVRGLSQENLFVLLTRFMLAFTTTPSPCKLSVAGKQQYRQRHDSFVNDCILEILTRLVREPTTSLWHNSLIRISTFREFRSQQFHEGHNLFANYLDEDVPAMFEATL